MTRTFHYYSGIIAVVAALGLAACEGDTGPQGPAGNDGLGYVPVPDPDMMLADYDPEGEGDQSIGGQIAAGSTVWEFPLDGQVQLDLGDGTPPVVGSAIRYDADHDELWIEVDGEWVALTEADGFNISFGCLPGVPLACVEEVQIAGGPYAELIWGGIFHGPATSSVGYAHFGVKTAAADMPATGTASYSGDSEYAVEVDGEFDDYVVGAPTIDVDFETGDVAYSDTATGDTSELTITGEATIDGNSYAGSATGDYDPDGVAENGDELVFSSGDLSGMFYGPPADTYNGEDVIGETAGVLSAADSDATDADLGGDGLGDSSTGSVVGGFWAGQTSYTPPEI